MDPREMESLAKRLIENPHDQEALIAAHQAGQADPSGYAMFLEKVGNGTADAALSCHWLTEAANVWLSSLQDAPRAARVLMKAIERDPTLPTPGEKLAELYRERGDTKALVALLERRCKAIDNLSNPEQSVKAQAAVMREELGRLWSEPPLAQTRKAIDNFRRAIELDPTSQYAIYALREILKAEQAWADAVPYFELEQRLVDDPERKLALYQDEATVRLSAGDRIGAAEAIRRARQIEGSSDPALKQQLATMTLERVQAQEQVPDQERSEAAQLFAELAEEYPGEHGLSYSVCALETQPTHDRAVQLAMYYSEELGREAEVVRQVAQYLKGNPSGALAVQAREFVNKLAQAGLADESVFEALAPTAGAPATERVQALLDQANALARRARKPEAAEKYQQVLELDASNEEAVQFMEGFFRQRRKYNELRALFRAAAAVADGPFDARKQWLRELAGLCETQLRDPDGAIQAWQDLLALDANDEATREQLQRLLERAGRWDELVVLLEQQAALEEDIERRVGLERAIAKIHEQKRKDPIATGHSWARIAGLLGDDDSAILSAVTSFERAERFDLAAQCLADNAANVSDETARAHLFEKLGTLRESLNDWAAAGDAYAEAASKLRTATLFEAAEKCFVEAEAWGQAASVVDDLAEQVNVPQDKARLYATVAVYLTRAGDAEGALTRLEQATELDPQTDTYAEDLERIYAAADRHEDIVRLLLSRAEKLKTANARVNLRRRASQIQRETLQNPDAARESLLLVLADGDDPQALELLVSDAEERQEFLEVTEYLHRLSNLTTDNERKVHYLLREAQIMAEKLDDTEGAIARYERILSDFDPKHSGCLEAIADLYEKLDDAKGVSSALERLLLLGLEQEAKLAVARRLAEIYENRLDEPKRAIAMLDLVRELDEEDFEALDRLVALAEKNEDWERLARHLAEQLSVEGDEIELSRIARKLASLLHERLENNDEALSVLMQVADLGDDACREDYVALADKLGWKGIVATKLVEWNLEAPASDDRNAALRGAFDRFLEVGREAEAASVAKELIRAHASDSELCSKLEAIAVKLKDLETLEVAHDLLVQDLSGVERAEEMVRQAELMLSAEVEVIEAIQHGEQALMSVSPDEVEGLLVRLSKLAENPDQVIDIYERQITRCKVPGDRLRALARAAQVAAEHDSVDRARTFFDIALGGSVQEDTMALLEEIARETDARLGKIVLRRTLAEAFASGGQGSKDGGRTRANLLRRAAQVAFVELSDQNQAFQWLADSIVTHVDDEGLDELERLAREVGDVKRAEAVLSRALEEVFDGPLVRRLLSRRASLRRNELSDPSGAAQDLKRLHDLSPSDLVVIEDLAQLYQDLGDYRGMVQLLEDQILRGKDPAIRAELARKVARLWEEKLGDAREAADAWRRVLRLKQGDPEATEGLDRAKSNMLKRAASEHPAVVPGAVVAAKSTGALARPAIQPSPEEPPVEDANERSPTVPIAESEMAEKLADSNGEGGTLDAKPSVEAEALDVGPGAEAGGLDEKPSEGAEALDAQSDDNEAMAKGFEGATHEPSNPPDDKTTPDFDLMQDEGLAARIQRDTPTAESEHEEKSDVGSAPLASGVVLSEAEPVADSVKMPDFEAAIAETAQVTAAASKELNNDPSLIGASTVSVALSDIELSAPADVTVEDRGEAPKAERVLPPPPPPRVATAMSRPPPPLPPRATSGRPPPPPPSLRPTASVSNKPPPPLPPMRPVPPPHPAKAAAKVANEKNLEDNDEEVSLDVDDSELIETEE
jgi:hypothetical protein